MTDQNNSAALPIVTTAETGVRIIDRTVTREDQIVTRYHEGAVWPDRLADQRITALNLAYAFGYRFGPTNLDELADIFKAAAAIMAWVADGTA